jgi:hypothetical protein
MRIHLFQLSAVDGGMNNNNNNNSSNKTLIRKGDEVKFQISEKNGKCMAFHVTVLPIPFRLDENACEGIILLQPTHTQLKSSSSNVSNNNNSKTYHYGHSNVSSSNGSRWDEVSVRSSTKGMDDNRIWHRCY